MQSISRRSALAVPTVLFFVWAAGCADSDNNSVGSSQISVALSASSEARETTSDGAPGEPGEVTAAVVTIERIYLVGGGGTDEDDDDHEDDADDHDDDHDGDDHHGDVEDAGSGGGAVDAGAGDAGRIVDAGRDVDAGQDALADAAPKADGAPDDLDDAGEPPVPNGARRGKGKDERSEGNGHGGSVVLLDDPVTIELFELEALASDLVDHAAVPAGRYSQLRFVISGGYIQVSGEGIYATSGYAVPEGEAVVGELRMPSYSTSGFKVILPGGSVSLEAGEHALLRVDFDVSESFGRGTGSGDWIMRPTLRATDGS